MPVTFWDDRKDFLLLCQTLEREHAQTFQTPKMYAILRKHPALASLRHQVLTEPRRRPSTAFYLSKVGMTMTEFAFHDVTTRMAQSAQSAHTTHPAQSAYSAHLSSGK